MKITKTTYPGWSQHQCYHVGTREDFNTIEKWMWENQCESFMLSSGSSGYVFQVRSNNEWFALRWS